jgi:hypothetical protein
MTSADITRVTETLKYATAPQLVGEMA